MQAKGWAVWFTGLPGSGKSSVARRVKERLASLRLDVEHLEMDARRKAYTPDPDYSEAERERAYEMFAQEAAFKAHGGTGVIMDASAPRRHMRDRARALIERFAEIHLACDLKTARKREASRPEGEVMADLYAKAMRRRQTGEDVPGLGEVIGVDVPFETDPDAELTLDAAALGERELAEQSVAFVLDWLAR